MGRTILVVDDEASIRELVQFNLENEGFSVISAAGGVEALRKFESKAPDLVVLDLMMPDMDGFDVCREIRKRSDVPILMLTAKDTEIDQVIGLELGADDYVTKPFSPRALVARIKAILRRVDDRGGHDSDAGAPLTQDGLVIDEKKHEVTLRGKRLNLTPKEFELLLTLAKNPGRVFTRELLLDKVWGYEFSGDTRTVDVHVRRLRKKIERDPSNPRRIVTVHGVGYKYESGQ